MSAIELQLRLVGFGRLAEDCQVRPSLQPWEYATMSGMAVPYLIGIAGPSCAGKSEVAAALAPRLHAPVVALDSYYRDLSDLTYEERVQVNFDDPAALDLALIAEHMSRLGAGEGINRPLYDYTRHTRSGRFERIEPGEVLVVEGLFALHWPEVRERLQLRVFVDAPDTLCLARRLARDIRDRGRRPESVVEQFERTVQPACECYIRPSRQWANLIVDGTAPVEDTVEAILAGIHASPFSGTRGRFREGSAPTSCATRGPRTRG